MEHHHDEEPVAVTQVPGDPLHWVGAEDHGQDAQVDDHTDRAGQQDNQSYKHLRDRRRERMAERREGGLGGQRKREVTLER